MAVSKGVDLTALNSSIVAMACMNGRQLRKVEKIPRKRSRLEYQAWFESSKVDK